MALLDKFDRTDRLVVRWDLDREPAPRTVDEDVPTVLAAGGDAARPEPVPGSAPALAADGDLLPTDEVARLESQLAELRRTAEGDDHHRINEAVEALGHSTEAFAAMRMNRGIRQALTGRRVEDV